MEIDFDEYVIEIADQTSKALGNTLDISTTRWISKPTLGGRVKDATFGFYVDGVKRENDIALLISGPQFPNVVKEAVAHAQDIALVISERLRKHVVTPIHLGVSGVQTYAAFPRLRPFQSRGIYRKFQISVSSRPIASWLRDLAIETKRPITDDQLYYRYFIRPLEGILDDERMPSKIKRASDDILANFQNAQPLLFTVAEHGDFWTGNVLFDRRITSSIGLSFEKFRVIDWRGSRVDGYPCIDLVRFCSSAFRAGSLKPAALMDEYLNGIGVSKSEMAGYCLLSIGQLGKNLDQFPRDDYYRLCERVFYFLTILDPNHRDK